MLLLSESSKPFSGSVQAWWKNNDGSAVHDLSRLEERMLGMEAEKDSLQLQVDILSSPVSHNSVLGERARRPDRRADSQNGGSREEPEREAGRVPEVGGSCC